MIVGVGEINDRPSSDTAGLDPAALMAAALAAADRDAGGSWQQSIDRLLVVPQIAFRALDVPAALEKLTGLDAARIDQAPLASGDTPVRLLHDAANLIADGAARVCAVVGGEALRTAARLGTNGGGNLFGGSQAGAPTLRRRYGLVTPSEIYPLYENALRAELGQTLDEAQAETGAIWSLMSDVAASSAGAWLKQPRTAAEIVTPSADNRPIVFPYTKLMVANASVNQGAATIVTSLAAAREAGIADDRLVHIGFGAAAHEADEPLDRAGWATSPSMRVSLTRTLVLNGLETAELDHVELYSCFPCVPKMARRILGWPIDRAVTVHGGLTFGGGPVGNYMGHAIAAMVRRLRNGSRHGLLFANGGHCSHNHSLVLSREPIGCNGPQDYDYQAEADAMRGIIPPLTDHAEGRFPVETYMVAYDRAGTPAFGTVLSRTPGGERTIARVRPDDARSIAMLTDGRAEPVGATGITAREADMLVWRAA